MSSACLPRHPAVAISPHATVTITRFDQAMIRQDHLASGTKALLDALKAQTNGRRDGRPLFYFGAILDDAERFISISWQQKLVSTPERTGMRITVSPTNTNQRPNHALQRTGGAVTPAASTAALPPPPAVAPAPPVAELEVVSPNGRFAVGTRQK